MTESAEAGFLERHHEVIGSLLSILALLISIGLGAGLMFATEARGIRALSTLLGIAGGTFTLLLVAIGSFLESALPREQWQRTEETWRTEMGLPAPTPARGRWVLPAAVLAILLGLSTSVLPALT